MANPSTAFASSRLGAFVESPLRARVSAALGRALTTERWYAAAFRWGLSGANGGVGDYSSTSRDDWDTWDYSGTYVGLVDPPLKSWELAYFLDTETVIGQSVKMKPSGIPAHNRIDCQITVTPAPFTYTGVWEPYSWLQISGHDGSIVTRGFDGDGEAGTTSTNIRFDWFDSWTTGITNGGEADDVVVTKTGSSTVERYEFGADPSLGYQYAPLGTNALGGIGSGWNYIDDVDFDYTAVITYSSDYVHSDFVTDISTFWDDLTAHTADFSTNTGSLGWNADATAIVSGITMPGGSPVNFCPITSGTGAAALVQWGGSATTDVDGCFIVYATRIFYYGNYAQYKGEFTRDNDPPDSAYTVTDRQSTLLEQLAQTVIAPSDADFAAFLTGTECIYTVAYTESYTETTPDFPVPG